MREQLTPRQRLRGYLLFRCLRADADVETAFATARRMAAFVIGGAATPGYGDVEAFAPAERLEPAPAAAPAGFAARPALHNRLNGRPNGLLNGRSNGSLNGRLNGRQDGRQSGRRASRPAAEPKQSPSEIMAMAEAFLAKHGPTREQVTIDTVVTFLRSRDFIVVGKENGMFELDSRHVVTAAELLERANRVRRRMGKPSFPVSVLQTEAVHA